MSETDLRFSQPESDLPEDREQEEPKLLKLTGQQRALYEALLEKEQGLPEKPMRLSLLYYGALTVLENEGNPDKMAQAAHSIRELMEKIPAIVEVETKAMQESLKSKVRNLEDSWEQLKKSIEFDGKSWSGQINGVVGKIFKKLHNFFGWFNEHHKRRKVEIDEILYKLDGSELSLPQPLRKLNVDYWDEMRDYFVAIAHHRKETTLEAFENFLSALEKFLLDRLSPRTFVDFEEIDQIIREGETSG